MAKVAHDPDELIAIVDGRDQVIGKATRKEVHSKGHKHRETAVLIINPKNEILLQIRQDNGKHDYSAAGHFPYDQDYLEAAVRETQEELGIKIPKSKFVNLGKFKLNARDGTNDRFVSLFEVKGDYKISKMKIDSEEVASIKYYHPKEILLLVKENPRKGGFTEVIKLYLDTKKSKGSKKGSGGILSKKIEY